MWWIWKLRNAICIGGKEDIPFDKAAFISTRVEDYFQATMIKEKSAKTMKGIKTKKLTS